jgi:TorA maturation chaperone TorD
MDSVTIKYLLSRSALYGLLARCFQRPENGWWETIVNLSKEVPKEWQESVQRLLTKGPPPPDVYMTLFGPAGACHDCETAFLDGLPTGGTLADVAGFYRAFSFPTASVKGNPPDHVATELEFLSFMFAKEAKALFQKDGAARKVCLSAREKFLREHLPWIHLFADAVVENTRHGFYTEVANLLQEVMEEKKLGK